MGKNIIINCEFFGKGPEELGAKVMGSFLRKLCNEEKKPEKIIFYNTGVKLMAEGSAVLDALELLEKGGVDLVACGTCVNYFGIFDKIPFGRVGDMPEIISIMMSDEGVVTI